MGEFEKTIGRPALLEQFAEECAEAGKAALKLSRILRRENPTPVTKEQGERDLIEEFTDVVQCALELEIPIDAEQMMKKRARWKERMEAQGYQD